MGHHFQYRQGVISKNPKLDNSQTTITPPVGPPRKPSREIPSTYNKPGIYILTILDDSPFVTSVEINT